MDALDTEIHEFIGKLSANGRFLIAEAVTVALGAECLGQEAENELDSLLKEFTGAQKKKLNNEEALTALLAQEEAERDGRKYDPIRFLRYGKYS